LLDYFYNQLPHTLPQLRFKIIKQTLETQGPTEPTLAYLSSSAAIAVSLPTPWWHHWSSKKGTWSTSITKKPRDSILHVPPVPQQRFSDSVATFQPHESSYKVS
jgi:hypothetical protein